MDACNIFVYQDALDNKYVALPAPVQDDSTACYSAHANGRAIRSITCVRIGSCCIAAIGGCKAQYRVIIC